MVRCRQVHDEQVSQITQHVAPWFCQRGCCPRRQTLSVGPKSRRASDGGQNSRRPTQKGSAGTIEIVEMLVVTEQHGVDGSDLIAVDGRPSKLRV
jgi:hypothetical protein